MSDGRDNPWLDPQWSKTTRVHDWRNYVSEEVRAIWHQFTNTQQQALYRQADDMASIEEWE